MTKQIAVRLPEELVEYIDHNVENGQAASRADAVAQAVEWQRRREVAARDAAILAGAGADDQFDALAEFSARTPMDDLD